MTEKQPNLRKLQILQKCLIFCTPFLILILLSSCHHLDCPQCGGTPETKDLEVYPYYRFELQEESAVNIGGQELLLKSFDAYMPEFKGTEGNCMLTAIIIRNEEDKILYGKILDAHDSGNVELVKELLPSIKGTLPIEPSYGSVIKRITFYSDADVPPRDTVFECQSDCITCWRDRDCIGDATGFIDKIELRAMGGWRYDALPEVYYPGPRGGTVYPKETLGFDRGGTDITIGLEASVLWRINALKYGRDNFYLGFMTGLWPVDGSIFVPLSLHARYTFDDDTDPAECDCNAWYLFGDIGLALDPTFEVPLYCNEDCASENLSSFWDLGIGYDFWLTECMDFSVDLGFRHALLPLPANTECEECTGESGKYPIRISNQVFLRFGLTW